MPRSVVPPLLVVLLIAAGAADDANWKRLESMPREQRGLLSRNLDRFDALPPADREAVRKLDSEIADLDPVLQARYLGLLRRYHAWLSDLSDARKAELARAGSLDAKLGLIDSWRKAERLTKGSSKTPIVLGISPGDLGSMPPFEMANALRVWFQLNADERKRVEAIGPVRQRILALVALGNEKKIHPNRFPATEEDALIKRIEASDQIKLVFPGYYRKMEKAEVKRPAKFSPLHHLTESLYFVDHPPEPVGLARLVQFEAELPPWFRASLDPLPPENARRRLTILYRQIYVFPAEIPPPKKPDTTKAPARPKAVGPKPVAASTPF